LPTSTAKFCLSSTRWSTTLSNSNNFKQF